MSRSLAFTLAVCCGLTHPGCSSKSSNGTSTCGGNNQCQPGEICSAGACQRLCAKDTDCASTETCDNSLCVGGSRPGPSITSIDGDSSQSCDTGTSLHCITAGIFVAGTNLATASFALDNSTTGASAVSLTVRPGATDTLVAVCMLSGQRPWYAASVGSTSCVKKGSRSSHTT